MGSQTRTGTHLATKTQWLAGIRILPPGVLRGFVGVMGGVAGIVEARSRGSATSTTGLEGVRVARGSKRVPHLRGLTVVTAVMGGDGVSEVGDRVYLLIVRRRLR